MPSTVRPEHFLTREEASGDVVEIKVSHEDLLIFLTTVTREHDPFMESGDPTSAAIFERILQSTLDMPRRASEAKKKHRGRIRAVVYPDLVLVMLAEAARAAIEAARAAIDTTDGEGGVGNVERALRLSLELWRYSPPKAKKNKGGGGAIALLLASVSYAFSGDNCATADLALGLDWEALADGGFLRVLSGKDQGDVAEYVIAAAERCGAKEMK
eukprot:CAMPEP_0194343960 /NCGR_PEP_ID=MMETSP0171-20130528/99370_1 /TAXON_ID=218684 /ORGANISM="Corethron pennatum, Strain L29A3" /LENGTH=213 /DNA_ID=CAMNT_0039110425 /DNA_START=117 /DNA_END=758 /DNA_ORIENTATION=-